MICILFLLAGVYSHSWLHCTKYEGDLEVFQPEQCLGNPRPLGGNRNVNDNGFGQDIGMDFRPAGGGARCQGNAQAGLASNYGGPANLVTYKAGQTYTLAWPPKNHVAAECTNGNIPDTFLRLYMTPYDETAGDPDQDTFKAGQVKASFSDDPHVRGQMDMKGFQNCPRFCDDTDKSLCTGTFTIGADVPPGVYTFQWYWAFNSEADLYATCWEATVEENTGSTPTPATPTAIESTTTTTTAQPTPIGCDQCCDASEIVAPGTGAMVSFSYLTNEESRWVDCPSDFNGQFKIFCLLEDVRLVDGFCNAAALTADEEKDQSGTVAGLAVALVFVTLAFIAYVAVTQGWVDLTGEGSSPKGKDLEFGTRKDKPRANSVLTVSNTELPVLPSAPATWYYTDASNQQKGPISQMELIKFVGSLNDNTARSTLVWDGVVCQDWTPIHDVPSLKRQLQIGAE